MKKRSMILLVLAILLMLGGTTSAEADAPRKVTGSGQWWDTGFKGWFNLNIHETDPGEAEGMLNLKEYDEEEEPVWRRWKGHPICIAFSETEAGEPAVSFVFQIDRISGWGPGQAGQYAKFWVSDGGSPATKDEIGLIVWPPVDDQPNCDYELPWYQFSFQAGDLVIHP